MFGVVNGMSFTEEHGWSYAVSVFRDARCSDWVDGWTIDEKQLVKTGRSMSESELMSGMSLSVSQDGEISE